MSVLPTTIYSTFDGASLAPKLQYEYDLPSPVAVNLVRRGYNDHYRVTDRDGKTYMLRVYLAKRYWTPTVDDLKYEVDLLAHLYKSGLPVSYPIPRRSGEHLGEIGAPEGIRQYALFTMAKGKPLGNEVSRGTAGALGALMARMHLAADEFASTHPRYTLDEANLIDQPLEMHEKYSTLADDDLAFIRSVGERVREKLVALPRTPNGPWGFIHGDLHSGNLHIADDGSITLFDFDHGGYGWRAYDLAVAGMGMSDEAKGALIDGYHAVRPLEDWERDAMADLAVARSIWDDGDMMSMVPVWGDGFVGRRQAAFLKYLREQEAKIQAQA